MREILFRGKRTDTGEWVYGSPIFQDNYVIIRFWNSEEFEYEEHLIIPETVGQYTGLTDKNGKKIFEGDIVKLTLMGGVELGEIDWSDYYMRYTFVSPEGRYGFDSDCVFEVIGNIHDNPELLKGGEAE